VPVHREAEVVEGRAFLQTHLVVERVERGEPSSPG
jgi:hypothetical protein